eukprot:m.68184 g.68184  ORF g.68184 m.68184 type:complete len:143 (+) comp11946_c0_seq5:305-733(+)
MGSCFSTTQLKNLTLFTFRRSPREWPLQRIRSNVILSPELTLKACNTHEYIIQYNLDLNLSSMFVLDTYLLVFGIILQEWKKMCRNIESPQIQILLGLRELRNKSCYVREFNLQIGQFWPYVIAPIICYYFWVQRICVVVTA